MKNVWILCIIICGVLMVSFDAFAEKYALLVGIDAYPGSHKLQGCVNDVSMMQNLLLKKFNFQSHNIVTLVDGQATRADIESAFQTHLIRQVDSGDMVIVYFSGHGTKVPDDNGDESDGYDEALCPVDITRQPETWLTDDTLSRWLSQLHTNQVTVILDTCLSSIETQTPLMAKSMDLGFGANQAKGFDGHFLDPTGNHVLLTGCAPGESSYVLPDAKGSVLTTILSGILMDAAIDITYHHILPFLVQRVQEYLSRYGVTQIPQIEGNANLAVFGGAERLQPVPIPTEQVSVSKIRVNITTDKPVYYEGEYVTVIVETDRDCYLKLYNVRADNQIFLIFPNEWAQNNLVRAGRFTIPDSRDNFDYLVTGPFGIERIIAAASPHQFDDLRNINWYGKGFPKLSIEPRVSHFPEVSYEVRPRY